MNLQHNPYAAPSATRAAAARLSLGHAYLKWTYLAALLVPFPLGIVSIAMRELAPLCGALAIGAMIVAPVIYLLWVARVWRLLPAQATAEITPAAAVAYHLVPVYGLVWMFACNVRIARSLRARTFLSWGAPTFLLLCVGLVVTCMGSSRLTGLMPFLPFVMISPYLWFFWMVHVDGDLRPQADQPR